MARPRNFDETRVIEALTLVFWEKGYEATSMQDLVAATGLLKGSLYGAFGDKQALYMIALAHYDQTRIQAGIDLLNSNASQPEKVSALFDSIIEAVQQGVFAGGCLLCNASMEMAPVDKSVEKSVQKTIQRMNQALMKALEGSARNAEQASRLSSLIISAYFGCRILAKAGAPLAMIKDSRENCLKCLDVF